jgi:acyl-CoA reductase-like NAD-dependent aldehyde dehydrogenase
VLELLIRTIAREKGPMATPIIPFNVITVASSTPLQLSNYVNGCFVPAQSGQVLSDVDPATGNEVATIPRSSDVDVEAAASAAKAAFPAWSKTSFQERAALLDRVADLIDQHKEVLAVMESEDVGKTLKMARQVDIQRAISNFRFFAGQLRHDETGCWMMHDAVNYAYRVPIGVCGIISPWNLPLYLLSFKVRKAGCDAHVSVHG